MPFDDETTDVLIGGYLSADAAHDDYEAVLDCGGPPPGRGRRDQGPRGQLSRRTDRSHGRGGRRRARRRSASWSACSRRRCSPRPRSARPSAPSAARRCTRRSGSKIEEMAGETIPIGGAGLIVAYPHSAAEKVEPAVTRAIQKVVGEAEGHHVQALKGALADAQEKMAQGSA